MFRTSLREAPAIGLILIACLILARYPAFHTVANLTAVGENAAFIGVMACGEAAVILSGGIDLSVGSVLALSACVAAMVLGAGFPVALAIAAGLATGAAAGALNGLLVTGRSLPPILTTLATLLLFRHGVSIVSHGRSFGPFPAAFGTIAAGWNPVWILLAVTVLTHGAQTRARPGRWIVALGAGDAAARLAGIPVARVRMVTFVLAGATAALGGLIVAAFNNNAQASMGMGYELDVIGACVVGGVRITGGEGSMAGAVLGAIVVALLRDGLVLTGRPAEQYGVFTGIMVLLAALFDRLGRRRRTGLALTAGAEGAA